MAVSTNGCIQGKTERQYFQKGLAAMVEALKPKTIINYSQAPDNILAKYAEAGIDAHRIENYMRTVRGKAAGKAAT